MAKMRIMQAYGQLMINERRTGAGYLQEAYKELNWNLQSVVESQRDVNEQIALLLKYQSESEPLVQKSLLKDL